MFAYRAERDLQRFFKSANIGSARQWQVQGLALARAHALFVGMAPEEGIIGRRVGMDGDEKYVRIVVEDVLCAVAVVIIDVDDRHAAPRTMRTSRGDRGSVEVGIAAAITPAGMMARWPA